MDPLAPPVVAVVVTRDPGPWFEETLASLAAQDYPSLSVLVVDSASSADPTPRVASELPGAFVLRLAENRGYAAAANRALQSVEGASHLLFCHDDVAPEPDAVRLMVEEAFRSNAGVVTPKLVDWSDRSRLLQVGLGADKSAAPARRVEPGELDQEQHDAVRDVFAAPGAFMLVRADLFSAIGGFDESMVMFREDIDLSWRAQIAGARVVVAPAARVRHLEAASAGKRSIPGAGPRFGLERRNELRAVLKDYGRSHLLRVLPQLLVLDTCEAVYDLLVGRAWKSAAIFRAWRSNLSAPSELRSARRDVSGYRIVPDHEVRRLQVRGSERLSSFVRAQLLSPDGLHVLRSRSARDGRAALPPGEAPTLLTEPGPRSKLAFWVLAALVLAYGARQLLGAPLPVIGQLAHVPGSGTLLAQFTAGWRTAGVGSQSSTPPAFGLLGLSGVVTLGSTGLLQKILFVGSLPAGAVGAYRMARPLPTWSRLLAALVYLAIPLSYNAMAQGHLQALLVVAASPWLLSRLVRASRLAPFGTARPEAPGREAGGSLGREWRTLARQALCLGLLVALLCSLVPAGFIVTLLTVAALCAAIALTGELRGALRVLVVGVGSIVVAVVLTIPWSLSLLSPGAQLSALTGLGYSPSQVLGLGSVIRFQTGELGSAPIGWAFAAAAALPLLIGRRWRLGWAARMWGLALVSWGAAWLCSRGWLGSSVPPADVLLGPAAAAVSLAVALGLVAFASDLPRYRFGWRQAASLLAAAWVALGCLPVLSNALGGRWDLPSQGYDQAMSFLPPGAYRVLWIGDPAALPLQGWQLARGVSYGTSESGVPDATDLLPYPHPGPTSLIASSVDAAWRGQTSELGHLLATLSVRYIVVPSGNAPPAGVAQGEPSPPPPSLPAALLAQDDLRQLNTDPGLLVLQNSAWAPQRAVLTAGAAADSNRSGLSTSERAAGSRPVLPGPPGSLSFSGAVPAGQVFASTPVAASWNLADASGRTLERRTAFGWATSYASSRGGEVRLGFDPPATRYLAVALELLLWVLAIAVAYVSRSRAPTWRPAEPLAEAEHRALVGAGQGGR
jgi:GT2 family glycosyltransferase